MTTPLWTLIVLWAATGCTALPASASLEWRRLVIHDQGADPTCAGHSTAQAVRLAHLAISEDPGDLDGDVAYHRIVTYGRATVAGSAAVARDYGIDAAGVYRTEYRMLSDADELRAEISAGNPVLVSRQLPRGGHQEVAVEYAGDLVRLLNSWGPNSGDGGTEWVPAGSLCRNDGAADCAVLFRTRR